MPDLRFLNVRFNLNAPDEQAIFKALNAYPTGARSQVVRKALAAYLGIEIGTEESRATQMPARKSKPLQTHGRGGTKAPKTHIIEPAESSGPGQEKHREKHREEPAPESVVDSAHVQEGDESVDERDAVKGLLSMLH